MALTVLGFGVSWWIIGVLATLLMGREAWRLTYFQRYGVAGPKPFPLFGHTLKFMQGIHNYFLTCQEKYGTIFGIYIFSSPVIVISDPDMIRDITVKSFSKFMNHKVFVLLNKPFDKSLTMIKDQHWKNVRNVITPTFSAHKMKQMSPLINECCDSLVANFREMQAKDNEVQVNSLFEAFTMDGIAKCAFGLQVDSQHNPLDPFVTHAKAMANPPAKVDWRIMVAGICPPLGRVMNYFDVRITPKEHTDFFLDVVRRTMTMRREDSNDGRKDFLQLMLNAHDDESDVSEDAKTEERKDNDDLHNRIDQHHNTTYFDSKTSKKYKLTTDEVLAQSLLFFIAGYETTNVTLIFLAYSMATNPDVQAELIAEVDEVTPTREDVTYSSVAKMPYLDAVVCETLRLYPAASVTERECNETYTYKDITIHKGNQLFINVFPLHRNADFWPDPLKFDPTRFTKENRETRHPFAWLPFGAGPRNCIGMRFALLEVKMALVRLLQNFRFETAPSTQVPVKIGIISVKPTDPVILRVVERNPEVEEST